MESHFFAYMARMKYIRRWGLMKSTQEENIQEHSLQTAMIAHALGVIGVKIFHKSLDPEHIMALAMYHETSEVLTGDLVTPIKYFNPEIRNAYKQIEEKADEKLLEMIPEELQEEYRKIIGQSGSEEYRYVKAADKLCAYLKCVEELRSGNMEYVSAKESIQAEIEQMSMEEINYFMEHFAKSFEMTLDEMKS